MTLMRARLLSSQSIVLWEKFVIVWRESSRRQMVEICGVVSPVTETNKRVPREPIGDDLSWAR